MWCSNDKCGSKMTPKFLTEEERGMEKSDSEIAEMGED